MTKKRTRSDLSSAHSTEEKLAGRLATLGARKPEAPAQEALRRWSAVPLLYAQNPPAGLTKGRVVYDAWREGGVALRDATAGHTRRLTLGSGPVSLDLVAWREEQGWRFVARVRTGEHVSHDFVLKTGKRRHLPQSGGFFQWQSRGVPRALELWSRDIRIVFESIAWT